MCIISNIFHNYFITLEPKLIVFPVHSQRLGWLPAVAVAKSDKNRVG